MAKKDYLSSARGMDALFSSSTIVNPKEEEKKVSQPKTQARKKTETKPLKEKVIVSKEKKTTAKTVKPKTASIANKSVGNRNTFSVDLEGLRKKGAEYTGIRLRRELFLRLQAIAEKEKLKSTNSLISTILEAYCNGYEGR